jgi:hypothetical protein
MLHFKRPSQKKVVSEVESVSLDIKKSDIRAYSEETFKFVFD